MRLRVVAINAALATALVLGSAGSAAASTVFYSGLGSAGVTRAKAAFRYTETANHFYDGDWAKDNSKCDASWADRFEDSKNGKFVDTLAGYSYGRLGPIYFLKNATAKQRRQIDYVLMYDPGNADNLSLCDTKIGSSAILARWLDENVGARFQMSPDGHDGRSYHGPWQFYGRDLDPTLPAAARIRGDDGVETVAPTFPSDESPAWWEPWARPTPRAIR